MPQLRNKTGKEEPHLPEALLPIPAPLATVLEKQGMLRGEG